MIILYYTNKTQCNNWKIWKWENYMLLNTCFVKFYIILQKTRATVEVNDLKEF